MTSQMKFQEFGVKFFEGREVRAAWHEGEWWYSTADAVGAFAGSDNPSRYWSVLKSRLKKGGTDPTTICSRVKMLSPNGKKQPLDASNEQMLLRIVQSMPTARTEPVRLWLAEVGAERLREERDPELITQRAIETNRRRYGMSEAEAVQAVQATAARKHLTGVWKSRDVREGSEFAILTDTGHKATFDTSIAHHKEFKGLGRKDNLRPHMTDVERALTMLQETVEINIIETQDLRGFYPIQEAAYASGNIAAEARESIERVTGEPVVSSFNRKRLGPPPHPVSLLPSDR